LHAGDAEEVGGEVWAVGCDAEVYEVGEGFVDCVAWLQIGEGDEGVVDVLDFGEELVG